MEVDYKTIMHEIFCTHLVHSASVVCFIHHVDVVLHKRPLPDGLKAGESNLLVVSSGNIYSYILDSVSVNNSL